jgi:hypothetical protein
MLDEGAYTQSKSQSIHYSPTRSHVRGKKKIEEEETYKCKQAVIVRFPFE